jgi:hypothetical protein
LLHRRQAGHGIGGAHGFRQVGRHQHQLAVTRAVSHCRKFHVTLDAVVIFRGYGFAGSKRFFRPIQQSA